MGILDFLSKKGPAAPAPAGATETSAASPDALKAEITGHGLDASRINVAVDGSTVTLTGGAATTADAEKAALAVGNTKGVTQVVNNIVADAPHEESGFYTVKSGDTLWKIAEESYGHGQGAKYEQIFEANRPLLKNADAIFPGQVLRIPGATTSAAPKPQASAAPAGGWKAPQEIAATDAKPGDDVVWKAPTT
ncbi:MAG: peptidoglycan-binding protein LysM [Methylocystis sp.]